MCKPLKFFRNNTLKKRTFSFRSNNSSLKKPFLISIIIIFLMFFISISIFLYISRNNLFYNINNHLIDFLIHIKATLFSLYYSFLSLLSIVLIIMLFLLSSLLFISALFRLYKVLRYSIKKKSFYKKLN